MALPTTRIVPANPRPEPVTNPTGAPGQISYTQPAQPTTPGANPATQAPQEWTDIAKGALDDWQNLWPTLEAKQGTANAAQTRQAEGRMAAMGKGFGGAFQGTMAQSNLLGQQAMRQALVDWTKGGVDLKNQFASQVRGSEEAQKDRDLRLSEAELQFQTPQDTGDTGVQIDDLQGGKTNADVTEISKQVWRTTNKKNDPDSQLVKYAWSTNRDLLVSLAAVYARDHGGAYPYPAALARMLREAGMGDQAPQQRGLNHRR